MHQKKIGSKDARRIVAELYWRERFALQLLNQCKELNLPLANYEMMVATRSAHWAEAHNAAVTAKKILLGVEL